MIKILRYARGKGVDGKLEDLKKDVTVWVDCCKTTKKEIEDISK